jgi:hypothetical protein
MRREASRWVITELAPQVAIRAKRIFAAHLLDAGRLLHLRRQ